LRHPEVSATGQPQAGAYDPGLGSHRIWC